MTWIDNLINKILNKPEVIHITFKGKATTDPFEIAELNRGWKGGYDHAINNWSEGSENFKVFPIPGVSNAGFYGNGFAEGVTSGIHKHLFRLYPGAKELSYNRERKKYDAKY